MTTETYIEAGSHIPSRLKELWIWFEAVYEWDWGDPGMLAELIRNEPLPPEFQMATADIVAGVRKRHKYGKSAIPAQERMQVARFAMELSELGEEFRSDSKEIHRVSDKTKNEPIETIHATQTAIRNKINSLAMSAGVSVETCKNLRRDLQARINRWPVV